MENVEIARILNEYADLLEIRDANPFRVRSCRKAAQTVAGLSRPVAWLVEAGEAVTELPGIGSSMAAHLTEIVETGSLAALGQMRQEFPETLTELLRLETLGPKKARKLYHELGITSVSELAAAIEAGKVEALAGFGPKTAANLRRAIAQSAQHMRRFLLADADRLLQPLLNHLRAGPGIEDVDVAGSYRRRQETVGDIDLLAICEHPPPLMQHFLSYPDVEHVEMAGTTRGEVCAPACPGVRLGHARSPVLPVLATHHCRRRTIRLWQDTLAYVLERVAVVPREFSHMELHVPPFYSDVWLLMS